MRRLDCRIICAAAIVAGIARAFAGAESADVTLDYVADRAEQRAEKPFHSPRVDLPDVLRADKLDYDKYREIRFRRDQALWSADHLPFEVEFFHPGYIYQEPVHINEFSANYVQSIRFNQDYFDYGKLTIRNQIPSHTGYAGFRVLYALNDADRLDELGAFLGASYFRLLGKGQRYGASARGLALDCGEQGRPEEFPIFTDWWLGKPQPGVNVLHLFALLDSVSCTGAYEFTIYPGESTRAEINTVLFLRPTNLVQAVDPHRQPLDLVGWAPLTSMFWFGENSERRYDDYRPEVHDSDGLLMQMNSGENLWRPLDNPPVLRHQVFSAPNVRGFGLLQRDRQFTDYQDLFNAYHLVPSVWVERRGNWGEGSVHLVELNTEYEGLDNIVAFWEPKEKPTPAQPVRFSYVLHWTRETEKLSLNRAVATRMGLDLRAPNERQIAIDFAGPKLASLPDGVVPEVEASCGPNATIVETQAFPMPTNGLWRAMIKMQPKPGNQDPVDLRCVLKRGEEVLTETWTYLWSPP